MNRVITEITPLSDKDCFYLVDRHKTTFDYPMHRHGEYELNFVSNSRGARRIVGDSIEELGDYDLVLIGPDLEHCWEQYRCGFDDKREVTVQFHRELFGETLLAKNQMRSIRSLLDHARSGLAFGTDTLMRVFSKIDELCAAGSDFVRLLKIMEILYILSVSTDARSLASSSFSNKQVLADSRRISKVEEEIRRNYKSPLTLDYLAGLAGMTPTAFSRFFKVRTGRTLSEYIIDIRLGHAARRLVDTTMSISEICYDCGFNNISNFNRAFKRKRGCTPKTFRENYLKTKVIV